MKKTLLLYLNLLLLPVLVLSQEQWPTYVFAISADLAEDIYRHPGDSITIDRLHAPVDSFVFAAEEQPRVAGHYLYIRPDLEELDISIRSYHPFRVEVRNNERDLALEVIDALGQSRRDASLQLKKRIIPYDEDTQTYRLKNWAKDGFLKIAVGQDTFFYDLEGRIRGPLFFRKIKYWQRSKAGYWVTTPVRWVKNTYEYFRGGIRWGDWGLRSSPFWFLQSQPGFRGYIALSQPSYRPQDTLQLKAYLANQKGKPWSKPAHLQIYTYVPRLGRSQELVDTLLSADTAGHFVFNQVLSDSLPLDLTYYISLEHARRENFEPLSHSFKLEDYELDEAKFSLSFPKKDFHRGEKIAVQAEGRDQNQQFVAGAEVRLTLVTGSIDAIYADSLSIPDTLWVFQQTLRNREPSQLMIPDSIFPAADLQVRLLATFIHPSGELHQEEETFHFKHRWDELVLRLEQDTVVMDYQLNGISQPFSAALVRSGIQAAKLENLTDTIQLPHREVVSPYIEQYILAANGQSEILDLNKENDSKVNLRGSWQPDTLTLTFVNPRQLAVTWILQTRTRVIRRGVFTESQGELKIPVDNRRQWNLSYEYFWGYPKSGTAKIYRLDKQLAVSVEQPPRISPGETVQIKVKVQDPYGQPASSVQLASAAVNSQFDVTGSAYLPPSIPYKTSREPFTLENFDLDPCDDHELPPQKINRKWFQKLNLSTIPFYQMRYRNPGVWTATHTLSQDTFYRQVAQVAPYLIRNYQNIPIYLIYMNNDLVYYHETDDHPPYSFVGQAGFNRISLRTRTAEYTLDSVWLEVGQKLELAIDPDRFRAEKTGIRLRQAARPAFWTPQEKAILANSLLQIDPKQAKGIQFFWDQPTNIHRLNLLPWHNRKIVVGPFHANTYLHYVLSGKWEKTLFFEPRFSYLITEKQDRLYEWKDWTNSEKKTLGSSVTPPVPGQLIYRPEDVQREVDFLPVINYDLPDIERRTGQARMRFLDLDQTTEQAKLLALVLYAAQGTEWILPTSRAMMANLAAGQYRLYLVREDGLVKQWEIKLMANTTFALDLSSGVFAADSLRTWPDRLYSTSKARLLDRKKIEVPRWSNNNPYQGRGRLIQGRMTDSNGEPLIGGSILIKGTTSGTVTDFDGNYAIWVPEGVDDPTMVFSYTGFNTQEYQPGLTQMMNMALEEGLALEEVVVTGSAAMRSMSNPAMKLQGKAAGVEIVYNGRPMMIRGLGTIPTEEPLIIINGQMRTMEDLANISSGAIQDVKVLKGLEATTLYGARGASGVFLITIRENQQLQLAAADELEPAAGLRNQFRDHAFWQPYLMTDKNGEAFFQATYPDNITAWNTYVLGMDRKQRAGVGLARTQAWKSLTARLSLPRFMLAGDEADVVGQAINYTDDSLRIATFFRQGAQELSRQERLLGEALTENYHLAAPADVDSISLIYGLEQGNYLDGEQRDMPVFPVGSLETEGYFMVLRGDTAVDLSFTKEGPITLFAADNNLELLMEDLNYLKRYPQECMEQTASRLIALCLEKQVRKFTKEKFVGENDIRKMLRRLEKAQNSDGSWAWWPGNTGSLWITRHVLQAIRLAVPDPAHSISLEKGLRYVINVLPALKGKEQLLTLDFLAECQQKLDYNEYLNPLDTAALSLHERLLTARIRQRMDLPYHLDTLAKYRRETLYGAYFWGENDQWPRSYHRLQHPLATTLVAYELLQQAGRSEEAERVQQYFLEERGIGQEQAYRAWYNTYETARVLTAILPDLIGKAVQPTPSQLTIQSGRREVVEQFPYRAQWLENKEVSIQKTGSGPLYLTAYQQYHNSQPPPKADIFSIFTKMIQQEREVTVLRQGTTAVLEVSLQCEAAAEYVMLEIPIPAGCSYADRSQKRNGLEDHREYAREKVVIFCADLPAGSHTFKVELEPRFTGSFTLNPVRAEQMYFPVLFGRNGIQRVEIR